MLNKQSKSFILRVIFILIVGIVSILSQVSPAPVYAQSLKAISNECRTAVGTITPDPKFKVGCDAPSNETVGGGTPPTACERAPQVNWTSAQQYADDIRAKWGIIFTGISIDELKMFREEFYEITCVGFLQELRGTTIEGWDLAYSQQFHCPGEGGTSVMFSRVDSRGVPRTGEYLKSFITHELTHVWQFCSPKGEANFLLIPNAYDGEGGISNYSRNGCGYASGRDSLLHEDHADTIALYLNPTLGELTCGNGAGNPFSGNAHPLHRAVAQKGVGR